MRRYLRLYRAFMVNCLAREMEYRAHFLLTCLRTMSWGALSVLFLGLIFRQVRQVAGWTLDEMLLLTGTFNVVQALLALTVGRNMGQLSRYVNRGELDLVLTKPVSAQFYVSTRLVAFPELATAALGLAVVAYAWGRLGLPLGLGPLLAYAMLVLCGVLIGYALWFSSVVCVFWAERLSNIHALFDPVMELARVPTEVYRGLLRAVFSSVVPLAFLATVPAKALLGRLAPWQIAAGPLLAITLLWLSNRWWRFALRRYTSASS